MSNENGQQTVKLQEMKKLPIKIKEKDGCQVIDARELHNYLEVGRDYSNWVKGRIKEYGFIENEDFEVFAQIGENSKGGRPAKEYAITLDMGKELAMVEKNEKGREARKYFIAVEKAFKEELLQKLEETQSPQLEETASYKEGEIFISKLGTRKIKGMFKNGELWFGLSTIMKHLGYSGGSKNYAEKFGKRFCYYYEEDKLKIWFVNKEWVDVFLKNVKGDVVQFEQVSVLYNDLFRIKIGRDGVNDEYSFIFTDKQMNNIIQLLASFKQKPGIVTEILTLIMEGKKNDN